MPPSGLTPSESSQSRTLDAINQAIAELARDRGTLGSFESRVPLDSPEKFIEELLRLLEELKMSEHLIPPSMYNEGFESMT